MSHTRSEAPEIPGFRIISGIGAGGFADVFLYEQTRLGRRVAVKVLRPEHVSEESVRQFATEGDVMAVVSTHPYIVTIYDSGVAPDGRPYIVMEHYTGAHFGDRARGGALPVSEVLQVAVQVASAIETAHRAGILHRDIKPANILTSAYGRPGLTDFGISGVQTDQGVTEATGVSVAFAAPEVLNLETDTGSERSDVYSFAATLWAMLAGRAPYSVLGGDNTDDALTERILHSEPTFVSRDDVPASLNHLLLNAMSRDISRRPPSALSFARDLQDIEQELRLAPTPIEVRDDLVPIARGPAHDDTEELDGTRRRDPASTTMETDRGTKEPQRAQPAGTRPSPPVATDVVSEVPAAGGPAALDDPNEEGPTVRRGASKPAVEVPPTPETPAPAPALEPEPESEAPAPKRQVSPRQMMIGVTVLAMLLIVVLAVLKSGSGGTNTASTTTEPTLAVDDEDLGDIAPPTDGKVELEADGRVQVSWTESTDSRRPITYSVYVTSPEDGSYANQDDVEGNAISLPLEGGSVVPDKVCVEIVTVIRSALSVVPETACSS